MFGGFTILMQSVMFIKYEPKIAVFTILRFILFLALSFTLVTLFLKDASVSALKLGTIFALFDRPLILGIPAGIPLLAGYFLIDLMLSVATIAYATEALARRSASLFSSIAISFWHFLRILPWSVFFGTVYFGLLSLPMPTTLLVLPWVMFPTFCVAGVLSQHGVAMSTAAIESIQIMQHNILKIGICVLLLGTVAFLIGLGQLQIQYTHSILKVILSITLWLCLTTLSTIRDIFVAHILSNRSTTVIA